MTRIPEGPFLIQREDNWCQFTFRASIADADSSLRGRPRGRGDRLMPNRAATPSTQAGEPIGRPVRSESRTAVSSSCFGADRSLVRQRRLRSASDGRVAPTRGNPPGAYQLLCSFFA